MMDFVYPVTLTPDEKDGGFIVKFIDFSEAITQGENIADALSEATDCLEEAIANRIVMGLPIPEPSSVQEKQYFATLSAQMAIKASLYIALKEMGINKVELAKRLGCDEKAVRRLLDPHHSSKLSYIEAALAVLGKQLVISFRPAA